MTEMRNMVNRKRTDKGYVIMPVTVIKQRMKRLYETLDKKVKFFKTERETDKVGTYSVIRFKIMNRR